MNATRDDIIGWLSTDIELKKILREQRYNDTSTHLISGAHYAHVLWLIRYLDKLY